MIKKRDILFITIILFSMLGCGSSNTSTPPTTNTENNEEANNNPDNTEIIPNEEITTSTEPTKNIDTNQQSNNTEVVSNDTASPQETTLNYPFISYDLKEYPTKIILSSDGTQLYILNGIFGVTAIDIQDINNPLLLNVGGIFPSGTREVIDIVSSPDNNRLYVGASDGIYIYDTSNSNQPILISRLPNSFVNKLTISKDGKTLYAVGSDFLQTGRTSGLIILDVTDLDNISQLGFYQLIDIEDIQLSPNEQFVYLASGENKGGMEIINIVDPTQPTKASSLFDEPTEYVSKIVLSKDGTRAYVANNTLQEVQGVAIGKRYLSIVNIENPKNPIILKNSERYSSEYIYFGMELSLDEQYLYIGAGSKGFTVTSVLNDTPIKVGRQDFDGNIMDFALSNDKSLAYMITSDQKKFIIMQVEG